jgi:hypothetical protein
MSSKLLKIICLAEHQSWQYFVTFNESSFYLLTIYEIIRLPDSEIPSEMEMHMIQIKNDTHNRIQFIRISRYRLSSKRRIFNVTYYIEHIL